VIEVDDRPRFSGGERVATENELIVLKLLAAERPICRAGDRVETVNDEQLVVADVAPGGSADGDRVAD
jgi:hypothetical protein